MITTEHLTEVVERLRAELSVLEEHYKAQAVRVVGALVTFNCADAAHKVVHELRTSSVQMDYSVPEEPRTYTEGEVKAAREAEKKASLEIRRARLSRMRTAFKGVRDQVKATNWLKASAAAS